MAPAVQRVPVGAPLAHAEAVPPAVPGDDEHRLRRARHRDGRGRRSGRGRGGSRAGRAECGAGSEDRAGEPAAGKEGRGGEPEGGATHVRHGSRGGSRFRRAFTERFHSDWNGNKPPDGNLFRCLPKHACRNPHPPAAALRGCAPDRPRRHGRDLSGHRPRARARGRREAARGALLGRRRVAGPLSTRGPRRGASLGHPEHRHDLRRRRAQRPPADRHGVFPRRIAGAAGRTRHTQPSRPRARLARGDRRGARRGARGRDRAPRRQAGEPPARRPRACARRRLRHRKRGGPRLVHAGRDDHGDGRLSLARAGEG